MTTSWSASAANAVAATTSTGRTMSTPSSSARSRYSRTVSSWSCLEQALADLVALRGQEGEDHPAADQDPVGLAEQRVDDAELVGDLRAAEHDRVRPRDVVGQPRQHLDLGRDQPAGGVRQPLGDVDDGGVLAVHGTEAVGDVRAVLAHQRGELVGERAALGVVLGGLARVEAQVLEQHQAAVLHRPDGRPGRLPHRVGRERDLDAGQQLADPLGHGGERVLLLGRALGPAEVGAHHDARAGVQEPLPRGQRRPDPAVVGDGGAVERHVQVAADQDLAAREVAQRVDPSAAVTGPCRPAGRGRRGGWSSPTRCRTSRRP